MKNRKFLVGMIVFAVLLSLGIGYAAVSKTLSIVGTSTTNNEQGNAGDEELSKNFLIKFDSAYTTDVTKGDGATVSVSIDSDTKATVNVYELNAYGKSVTATLTIVNESADLIATIDIPTITNVSEYFKVETDWVSTVLNPGESKDVIVTITLTKSPITHQNATFTIDFNAVASETA